MPRSSANIQVEVVLATALSPQRRTIELARGARVIDAIHYSGLQESIRDQIELADRVGIFSVPCSLNQILADGDRVEIYSPLIADAKSTRRTRAKGFKIKRPVQQKT
jgi:uncharacterized protein